ncbi:CRISPR-associated endoribonuclease Cas6 [Aquifex sp.]
MRVKVFLEVPKEVSIFYRRSFLSFIKSVIEEEDADYCVKIFKKGAFKPFTFCVFFGDIKVNGEKLYNNGKAILTVSSGSPDFFVRFYNGLKKRKEFSGKYINGSMRIIRTQLIEEEPLSDGKCRFRTLSPIVVVTKDKHPVLPEELKSDGDSFIVFDNALFTKELRFSLKHIFNGLPELSFKNEIGKKAVVKHIVGNNEGEKVIKIVAYQGSFTLEGDPFVLNEIYRYGLGFRRHQGFGCLEVIR